MSTMLRLEQYTRKHCLWRNSHLISPVFNNIRDIGFPREAIYHHMATDGVGLGPSMSDPIMQRVEGMRFIDHIRELGKTDSAPLKKLSSNITSMVATYKQRNRSFRIMRSVEKASGNPRNLLIFNYAMLSAAWRFPVSKFADMHMFKGLVNAWIDKVNDTIKVSDRQQYIIIDLPSVVPGIGDLKELGNNLTPSNVSKIPTFEDKFIFELYMYLGRFRSKSILQRLDTKALKYTNIVFRHLDKWTVVNLKWLSDFNNTFNPRGLYEVKRMEVLLLTLLGKLHEEGQPYHHSDIVVNDDAVDGEDLEDEDDEETETQDVAGDGQSEVELTLVELGDLSLFEDVADAVKSDRYDDDELDRLERELVELDNIRSSAKAVTIEVDDQDLEINMDGIPEFDIDMLSTLDTIDPDVPVAVSKAGELVANGLMTAAEYKRIERTAAMWDGLKDPYDLVTPITDVVDLDLPSLLAKHEKNTDDKVILDESLKYAKADDFQKQYIQQTLKKNLVQCIGAIQKGPISITDYTVETTKDSMNEYETHIVKLVPTVGKPSVIRQVVPVVQVDGTFKFNGVQHRMRMQRVDLPIRKVSATRVGLTSYYGKVFVERSNLKRFNYGGSLTQWLKNKIQDLEDTSFTDGSFSNVADTTARVPGLYGQIAEEISNFSGSDRVRYTFDYANRAKFLKLSDDELKLEPKEGVAFAKRDRTVYYMDASGMVFHGTKEGLVETGTFEDMIGLDLTGTRMPVTSVDMKIYSKSIPIGFCLGYLLGFERLLKLIKAKPRHVPVGERLNLGPSEYAIRFKNTSLVFDRKDVLVSLIMSGYNQYHRMVKEHDMVSFESKDTYSSMLDKLGIGNRYTRKLDSMSTYFVDPITEQLLTLMKEPTSFTGLLIRSCEMLVSSYVPIRPEKADPKVLGHMERLRGYERLAGFTYETMVKAIEQYGARASSGRATITVNPFETIGGLMQDPTVAPVNNLNPLQYLREREVTTFSGRGGRSKRSMVGSTRVYDENDAGFISEASVDSGDVGVITYVSQDTNVSTVYGTVAELDQKKERTAGKMLSTSANLAPGADGDDQQTVLI